MKKLLTGYIWPVGVVGASIFASAFGVALLTFIMLTPALTYASPHGNAWGYYGTAPGQLKKEFRREGIPGYGSFSDLGSLHEYIREYMDVWRELRAARAGAYYAPASPYVEGLQVSTGIPSHIGEHIATLHGTVFFDDSDEVRVWFEYGTISGELDTETTHIRISEQGTYTQTLDGLEDATRYYYRIVAENETDAVKRYGVVRTFITDSVDDDEPSITTLSAYDIEDNRADLRGKVDMEGFNNGLVFFVYGKDKVQIEDVAEDVNSYEDIDEDDESLQKMVADQDLDGSKSYTETITALDDDTLYYYAIGVAYENEQGRNLLRLGSIRSFRTLE